MSTSVFASARGPQGDEGAPGLERRHVILSFDPFVDAAVGDGQAFWFAPEDMDGWVLVAVHAGCDTVGTSGDTLIQLRNVTNGNVDMLSTRITINANENHSKDAAPPAINASNDEIAYGDKIVVDVDSVSTGTRGVQVQAVFEPA